MAKKYKPYHLQFWTAYFIHMRPYLLFLSGIAGLVGMALVSQSSLLDHRSILIFGSFFLAYGFGQALTDSYQIDTDKISAPYRPLSQGILLPSDVRIISLVGLLSCSLVLIYYNPWNIIFGALSIFGLATYTHIKKHYWFGGPLYNAWIVALLPIMGFMALSQGHLNSLSRVDILLAVLLNFFAYTNFVLIGYLKDIYADRKTGYRTFPVVFGWNATVWVSDLFLIACIIICSQFLDGNVYTTIFFILGSVIGILGQLYAHWTKNKTEENASFSILATVRAFILWNLGVILHYHSELIWFAVFYYLIFEIVIYRRPMKTQI